MRPQVRHLVPSQYCPVLLQGDDVVVVPHWPLWMCPLPLKQPPGLLS